MPFTVTMPLTEIRKINNHTRLARWALTETATELQQHPGLPAHVAVPAYLTHEQRRAEWLASRLLAYELLRQFTSTQGYILHHDAHGKPTWADCPYHISISHTQHEAAVILSDKYAVGIDIEKIKPKIRRVRDRFLGTAEKKYILDGLAELTIAWSAKETLYKLYGKKNIIFADHLHLAPFAVAETGALAAKIKITAFEQNYTVYFQFAGDTVLTYCLGDAA